MGFPYKDLTTNGSSGNAEGNLNQMGLTNVSNSGEVGRVTHLTAHDHHRRYSLPTDMFSNPNCNVHVLCGQVLRYIGDEHYLRACGRKLRYMGDEISFGYSLRQLLAQSVDSNRHIPSTHSLPDLRQGKDESEDAQSDDFVKKD